MSKITIDINQWDTGNWPDLFDIVTIHEKAITIDTEAIKEEIVKRIAKEAVEAYFEGDNLRIRFLSDGLHILDIEDGQEDVVIPWDRIEVGDEEVAELLIEHVRKEREVE